jgi:lipopolysaccharide export system protein LptC
MSVTAHPGFEVLQPPHHGSWEPRRALALNVARRRTAFVAGLRIAFLTAAIAIVILVAVQLFLGSRGGPQAEPEAVSTDVRMINPRYTGRDQALTPYTVTADVAIRRRGAAPGVTDLEAPRLNYDFLNATSDASQVLAETGRYDQPNRTLDLFSDVNLSTPEGYSFRSEHARIYLQEERVVGEEPVAGAGPMGSIRADRYEIREGGNHIIFEGNVRARLIQDRTVRPFEEGQD